ncbi:MAG: hypothetical protein NTZ54_14480 [Alphaproteobacteria bacterium]|uniref:hypothetical protein n=1 Tax=Aestuariivirga sp. TaxID=2650926 RepID=UPI00301B6669|nr:hypothetical protein [Alphaproteobacteria bacterium]
MNARFVRTLTAAALVLALAACAGPKGVRITNNGQSATTAKTPVPITNFTAEQIRAAISGKTFQYTRNDGNGFVTYNADGTFSFQDDAKGGGVGKWTANGTQFCETWGKSMPECGVFKNTGDAFFAANSRLVEMKT